MTSLPIHRGASRTLRYESELAWQEFRNRGSLESGREPGRFSEQGAKILRRLAIRTNCSRIRFKEHGSTGKVVMKTVAVLILFGSVSVAAASEFTVANSRELATALESAQPSATIRMAPGHYALDNPVHLATEGLSLLGAGRDSVLLTPIRPGMPVFVFDADNVSLAGVTIDGRQPETAELAAFGVLISSGVSGCSLTSSAIRRIQASAVVGYDVHRCTIADNVISGVGGDGVRLKGDGSRIKGNLIHDVFDEPLDLQGSSVVVSDNRIGSGRIGIALGSLGGSSVSGNQVFEQYEEGIVVAVNGGDVVANNFVDGAGSIAYKLQVVAEGGEVTIRDNLACFDGGSGDGQIVPEGVSGVLLFARSVCPSTESSILGAGLAKDHEELSSVAVFMPGSAAESEHDWRESHLARHLNHLNPGILSVMSSGPTMHSEITASLARTLSNWPDLASGPVRWPFLRSPGIEEWSLSENGSPAVLVTRRFGGSRIRVTPLQNGDLTLRHRAILLWDRIRMKWEKLELF